MDFNDATGKQRSTDLIPNETIAVVQLKIRPGNAGPDGMLKRSKNGNSEALDCELKVIGGQYHNRKFWDLITVAGVTERHAKAAEISHVKLCAILESRRAASSRTISAKALSKLVRPMAGLTSTDSPSLPKSASRRASPSLMVTAPSPTETSCSK